MCKDVFFWHLLISHVSILSGHKMEPQYGSLLFTHVLQYDFYFHLFLLLGVFLFHLWVPLRRILSFDCTALSCSQDLGDAILYFNLFHLFELACYGCIIKFGDWIKSSRELLISDMNPL